MMRKANPSFQFAEYFIIKGLPLLEPLAAQIGEGQAYDLAQRYRSIFPLQQQLEDCLARKDFTGAA